jgi:hypothetical protein
MVNFTGYFVSTFVITSCTTILRILARKMNKVTMVINKTEKMPIVQYGQVLFIYNFQFKFLNVE